MPRKVSLSGFFNPNVFQFAKSLQILVNVIGGYTLW